jgi:hypothetical protein
VLGAVPLTLRSYLSAVDEETDGILVSAVRNRTVNPQPHLLAELRGYALSDHQRQLVADVSSRGVDADSLINGET